VGENRGRLLGAALTILRAYCVAGRPDQNLPTWGSFEEWSKLIRSVVVWVGLPDPGETRLLLRDQSDVLAEGMGMLLECWERMDPDRRGLTAAEVIRTYKDPPNPTPNWHGNLAAALENTLGRPESRNLGNKLRAVRRRLFGGRFIDRAGHEHRAIRWAVYPS
jgi:hypothetical protein